MHDRTRPPSRFPMTAHDRRRVRRMIDAPDGARFPLELATGTVLHPGQVLHQCDGADLRRRRGAGGRDRRPAAGPRRSGAGRTSHRQPASRPRGGRRRRRRARRRGAGGSAAPRRRAVRRGAPRRFTAARPGSMRTEPLRSDFGAGASRSACCSCSTRSFRSARSRIRAASRPTPRSADRVPELRQVLQAQIELGWGRSELAAACLAWRAAADGDSTGARSPGADAGCPEGRARRSATPASGSAAARWISCAACIRRRPSTITPPHHALVVGAAARRLGVDSADLLLAFAQSLAMGTLDRGDPLHAGEPGAGAGAARRGPPAYQPRRRAGDRGSGGLALHLHAGARHPQPSAGASAYAAVPILSR